MSTTPPPIEIVASNDDPIEIVTTPAPDIIYTHGDLTFTMMGDNEEIVPWLEPDSGGVQRPPTAENFDKFLSVVTSAEDQEKIIEAIRLGKFKGAARYEASKTAWRNAMRLPDTEKLAARLNRISTVLADALGEKETTKAIEVASEDPAQVPFET